MPPANKKPKIIISQDSATKPLHENPDIILKLTIKEKPGESSEKEKFPENNYCFNVETKQEFLTENFGLFKFDQNFGSTRLVHKTVSEKDLQQQNGHSSSSSSGAHKKGGSNSSREQEIESSLALGSHMDKLCKATKIEKLTEIFIKRKQENEGIYTFEYAFESFDLLEDAWMYLEACRDFRPDDFINSDSSGGLISEMNVCQFYKIAKDWEDLSPKRMNAITDAMRRMISIENLQYYSPFWNDFEIDLEKFLRGHYKKILNSYRQKNAKKPKRGLKRKNTSTFMLNDIQKLANNIKKCSANEFAKVLNPAFAFKCHPDVVSMICCLINEYVSLQGFSRRDTELLKDEILWIEIFEELGREYDISMDYRLLIFNEATILKKLGGNLQCFWESFVRCGCNQNIWDWLNVVGDDNSANQTELSDSDSDDQRVDSD